jgi:hypothetical protein
MVALWNCDKKIIESDLSSQAAVVFVQHYNAGRRAPTWNIIYIPSIYVTADITGNPLPAIDYVQIANKQFNDSESFFYYEGSIHFSSYHRIWVDSIPEPKFNPLTIKISSNIGEIDGSITVPDTIETLTINTADTIPLGTPLTISWSGSNADYYVVCYYHNWMYDEWTWLGYSKDTLVKASSVTFDSSYFSKNGDISDFEIYPINGPFPQPGAEPNMKGDGYGFLYAENSEKRSDRTIVIGEGIDYSIFSKRTVSTSVPEILPITIQQKIKSQLDL